MENQKRTRRYEFDWLRVLAFSLLIFYHTGMFFVPWEWHLKNNQISETLVLPMQFLSQWRMSLIFLISGVGVYFALGFRPAQTFMKDRLKRICLPLVVGMLLVVPLQVYLERVTQGYTGTYLQFFPSIFAFEPYPTGNFSWHHLWYLAYVLTYSVLLLPILLYLRRLPLQEVTLKPWVIVGAPGLWLGLGATLLNQKYPATNALLDDWANHFLYVSVFMLGFVLMKMPAVQEKIKNLRFHTFGAALLAFSLLILLFQHMDLEDFSPLQLASYYFLKSFNRWLWILAILGMAMRYLSFQSSLLSQANEMVYPFYILHQTIIVVLGFYLKEVNWSVAPKFLLISLGTFALCFLSIRFVIIPINLLRVIFGLSPLRKHAAPVPAPGPLPRIASLVK